MMIIYNLYEQETERPVSYALPGDALVYNLGEDGGEVRESGSQIIRRVEWLSGINNSRPIKQLHISLIPLTKVL